MFDESTCFICNKPIDGGLYCSEACQRLDSIAASSASTHPSGTPGLTATAPSQVHDLDDLFYQDIPELDIGGSDAVFTTSSSSQSRNPSRTRKVRPSQDNSPLLRPLDHDDRRGPLPHRRSPYFEATSVTALPSKQRRPHHQPSASASGNMSFTINHPNDSATSSSAVVSPTLRPVLRYSRRAFSTNVRIPPPSPFANFRQTPASSSHNRTPSSSNQFERDYRRKPPESAPTSVKSSPMLEPTIAVSGLDYYSATQPPTPLALDPEHPNRIDSTHQNGNTIKSRKSKRQSLPLSFGLGRVNGFVGLGGLRSTAAAAAPITSITTSTAVAEGAGARHCRNHQSRDGSVSANILDCNMNGVEDDDVYGGVTRSLVMNGSASYRFDGNESPRSSNHVVAPSSILHGGQSAELCSSYHHNHHSQTRGKTSTTANGRSGATSRSSSKVPWNLDTQLIREYGATLRSNGIRSAAPRLDSNNTGPRHGSRFGFSSEEYSEVDEDLDADADAEHDEPGRRTEGYKISAQLASSGTIKRPQKKPLVANGKFNGHTSSRSHSHSVNANQSQLQHTPRTLSSKHSKLEGMLARRDKDLGSLIPPSEAVEPVETKRIVSSTSASTSACTSRSVSGDEEEKAFVVGRRTGGVVAQKGQKAGRGASAVVAAAVIAGVRPTANVQGRGRSPRRSTSVSTTARLSHNENEMSGAHSRSRRGPTSKSAVIYHPTFSSSSKSTSKSRSRSPASLSPVNPLPASAAEANMRASFDTIVAPDLGETTGLREDGTIKPTRFQLGRAAPSPSPGGLVGDRQPKRQDTIVPSRPHHHAQGRTASSTTAATTNTSLSVFSTSESSSSPSYSGSLLRSHSRSQSHSPSSLDVELDEKKEAKGKPASPMKMRRPSAHAHPHSQDGGQERGRVKEGVMSRDELESEILVGEEDERRGRAKERGRSLVR